MPVILKRRIAESSASAGSTDESDEDMIIIEARGSRKRTLPARFRDAPVTPIVRRRTSSTGPNLAEKNRPHEKTVHAPDTLTVALSRSPVKRLQKKPVRSPPSIAEKIAKEEQEEARAKQAELEQQQREEIEQGLQPQEGDEFQLRELGRGDKLPQDIGQLEQQELQEEQELRQMKETTHQVKTDPDLGMEMLQDVIDMDHGFRQGPPSAESLLRRRQRIVSRSSTEDHNQLHAPLLFQNELDVGQREEERDSEQILDDDDLIAMELEPMDTVQVPLPVDTAPRRPCKVCHRSLKVTNMKQHMLSHSGQRPFKCEFCWAAFTRRSDVFRHVKILHHQEKPFKCSKDGKEFSDRKSLKAHMEMHKRPALFACKVCDFRFGKFESYVNHVKNIHPTGEPLPNFPEEVEREPEPVAPPRGRYGPTPLQTYADDDDDDPQSGIMEGHREELQSAGALESIETEEIPHDSMHLVDAEVTDSSVADHHADGDAQHDELSGMEIPDVVEGQDVVIGAEQDVSGSEPVRHKSQDKDESQEHIDFPPLEEDAAAILGMTDLALTNEKTSLHSPGLEEVVVPTEPAVQRPVLVLSGSAAGLAKRVADPLMSTRNLSQPRVVTIGKPVTSGQAPRKTVLLTRPRMVAGKQVLQAVKLGVGQTMLTPRVPTVAGSQPGGRRILASRAAGPRQPVVRQVVLNRQTGMAASGARLAPRFGSQTRIVRPATRTVTITGARAPAAGKRPVLKTASPTIRVVRPMVPPTSSAASDAVLQSDAGQAASAGGTAAADGSGDANTKNIEVTTSTAGGGSRTIILQTSGGGGGDVLQSEEAMQTLLEAVQQLVAASGDTLEGKQIEIVMQNDGRPGASAAPAAEEGSETAADAAPVLNP